MITVYFDVETDSLRDDLQIIQLAAIAVDGDWRELGTFERKLFFDEKRSDKQALELNHYDPVLWQKVGVSPVQACADFAAFLKPHCTLQMISKRTGPYLVARLAGHNAATFDAKHLFRVFKECNVFLPADPRARCTVQRALWLFDEHGISKLPDNYRLETLCKWFGIDCSGAHDALTDVRLTIALAKRMAEFDGK